MNDPAGLMVAAWRGQVVVEAGWRDFVAAHPSHKNKGVARVGHPIGWWWRVDARWVVAGAGARSLVVRQERSVSG